jgi:hypothetical protein
LWEKSRCTSRIHFNAEKLGLQELVETREVRVIVPAAFEYDSINVPSNQSEKRAMMRAGISVDGCALKRMIIIQRKPYELELLQSRFASDTRLTAHRECGFIHQTLFDLWAETVLFPAIQRQCIEYHYKGSQVLISDGCTSHASDSFLDGVLTRNVTLHVLLRIRLLRCKRLI